MNTVTIFHHGDRAVCPLCGGYLKLRKAVSWLCVDCGSYFFPERDGITERELEYNYIKGAR